MDYPATNSLIISQSLGSIAVTLYYISSVCMLTDRDECRDESDDCSDNASCSNTEGSFMCQCLPGFEGDGRTCVGQ